MIPNSKQKAHDVSVAGFVYTANDTGGMSTEQITAACVEELCYIMRRIECQLNSLGRDGLHTLIRVATRNERAREKARRARARRKKAGAK